MSESKQDAQVRMALAKAIEVLYFDDGADYETALWNIVQICGGTEATELLEMDKRKAYGKYVEYNDGEDDVK